MLYVTVCCVLFMFWDPSATPLMLLFQVHKSFLPLVFSRFGSFRSGPVYSSIYLEIFVGARTCKCRVALPVLNVGFLCVGLFVSLCFSCAFSPLFCFFFCFLTCQTVEGRHTVSHFTVLWGVFWASGGRFCCSEPASPTFFLRVVCLVVEGDSEIYGEWQIIVPPPPPPPLSVLYHCEVMC